MLNTTSRHFMRLATGLVMSMTCAGLVMAQTPSPPSNPSPAPPAPAGVTIIEDWNNIRPPLVPEVKKIKVDPATTAFLVLDLVKQTCNTQRRPRCLASLPLVQKFLKDARAHNMPVIYSLVNGALPPDIASEVAPLGTEPVVSSSANKFNNTELEKILHDKNIKTVIIVGTTAQGAVLYTASQAAFLGFKVIVPVEGSTAESLYAEQATIWTLANAPTVGQNTTITKFDMIEW
jgi:nicotinamidase-related amidase